MCPSPYMALASIWRGPRQSLDYLGLGSGLGSGFGSTFFLLSE
jgi:hypothetical protein